MSNRAPWYLYLMKSSTLQPLSGLWINLDLSHSHSLLWSSKWVTLLCVGVLRSYCLFTPLKQPLSEHNGLLRYFFFLLWRLSVGVFFSPLQFAPHQNWWDLCSGLLQNEETACIITKKQSLKNKSRSAMGDPQRRGSSVALHNCQVMIRSL